MFAQTDAGRKNCTVIIIIPHRSCTNGRGCSKNNRRFGKIINVEKTTVVQYLVKRIVQYCHKFAQAHYYGAFDTSLSQNIIIENLMIFANFYQVSLGQNDFFLICCYVRCSKLGSEIVAWRFYVRKDKRRKGFFLVDENFFRKII